MPRFRGLKVKQVHSNEDGILDVEEVKKVMDDSVAALMVTVPNTLGIFEKQILEISEVVHDRGGLIYADGANLNALVGESRFQGYGRRRHAYQSSQDLLYASWRGEGRERVRVVVSERLVDFLPIPVVRKRNEKYFLDFGVPYSVGRFRSFYGNFGMLVRALCYIYAFGKEKLSQISEVAVLNANYLKAELKDTFHLPYDSDTLHEVVFSDQWQLKEKDVSTLDIAKRLMDFGFHPPTIYFPLVVKGALMIEPTETESKAELDSFVSAMKQIAKEAKTKPKKVKAAPHNLGIKRLDETKAARNPVLTWNPET